MMFYLLMVTVMSLVSCYDPEDAKVMDVLPAPGDFDPFYSQSEAVGAARAPHDHGSFFSRRNAALVQVRPTLFFYSSPLLHN